MCLEWIDVTYDDLPSYYEEVFVWIDGKRGPMWRNNHIRVAYRSEINNQWYMEGAEDLGCLVGVVKWAYIDRVLPT